MRLKPFASVLVARAPFAALVGAVAFAAACSGARVTELDESRPAAVLSSVPTLPSDDGSGTTPDRSDGSPGLGGDGNGNGNGSGTSGGTGNGGGCTFMDTKDHDGDGLSFAQGDCNDCNAKMRPGFMDTPGNGLDDDCSGKADDDGAVCDGALPLTSTSPYDAAKAIGLCTKVTAQSGAWGVIEAKWSKPDGTVITNPESWGLLPKLGTNVAPAGTAMLALSTGTARGPADPGYQSPGNGYDKSYTHGTPLGQPKRSSTCAADDPVRGVAHDGVALELKIRVPLDARSLSFTHQLFTADTPNSVCTRYNDVFVAMMDPKPAGTDGNVVFDALGDHVGLDSTSTLRACAPGTFKGHVFACPLGTASLAGTGFDDKSATGWLRTTVPVKGGAEITLRFAIWDSADGILDSTVLIDELVFSAQTAGAPVTVPR